MSKIAHSSACGGHFAPSAEMEKIELCAVIKFLNLKALTMAEIHNELVAVYGSKAPSISAVKERMAAFKRGREDLEDDPRSGIGRRMLALNTILKKYLIW